MMDIVHNGIYYIVLLSFGVLFLLKDSCHGASFGKHIMKIKVVDENNQRPAFFSLFLRNITLIIWPVELYLLFAHGTRLGEKLTNTKMIEL